MFLVADQRFLSGFVADQGLLDVFSGRVTVCHQVINCKQKNGVVLLYSTL
jgi:hypothetical protein